MVCGVWAMRHRREEREKVAFVLKYNDHLAPAGSDTISEHNKIVRRCGKAWYGKFGNPVSLAHLEACCDPTRETWLILLKSGKPDGDYAFAAKVCDGKRGKPAERLVPAYYRKKNEARSWFCLSEELKAVDRNFLDEWHVRSSGEPVVETAIRSMQGFFVAVEKSSRDKATKTKKGPKQHESEEGGDADGGSGEEDAHIAAILKEYGL